jgi:type VI secretion system protein ImpC
MPKSKGFEFGEVKLDVGLGAEPLGKPAREDPFRIVILGDFSGRGTRPDRVLKPPVRVDRDNFDDVLAAFAPALELPGAGRVAISELDDFHPDYLLDRQPFFAQVREVRRSGAVPVAPKTESPKPTPAPPPASMLTSGSLLDSILEATEERQQPGKAPAKASDPLRGWVEQVVAPHLVPAVSAAGAERKILVDRLTAEQMRALLHNHSFQSLEALWRSIYFLVRRTDTDGLVSIWLADVGRAQLMSEFESVYRSIQSKRPAVLVAAFEFGVSEPDLATLSGLGALAATLGASCVAGAQPVWIGCPRYEALESPREWASPPPEADTFRATAAAQHVGLAAPRFLVRLPYGAKTDACESFPFEEMPVEFEHERLLWGNSAILCACLLAESFNDEGWDMRLGSRSNIDGLPVYVHELDGETVAQPCAETTMTDLAARAIMDRGVMCVASLRDSDTVHLVRFQNAAAPAGPLSGPWSR